jgi:Zn-dependent peptidase ImmA (M78 family)
MQPAHDVIERACDAAAAEFLVPVLEMRAFWPQVAQNPERFQLGARRFKVSEIVVARRAADLGLISRDQFLEFYREYQERERIPPRVRDEQPDFYRVQSLRISRRFAETVVRALGEGKILYRDAFRLTGLYGSTFERYVRSIGMAEEA